jgi:predicted permease
MDVLYVKAIVSGICFGLWPLFINKSGLNSAEASAALSLFLLAVVSPFLLVNGYRSSPQSNGRWPFPPAYSMR